MATPSASANGDDLFRVLSVRAVIARAAASDSLRWWDDEALSDAGQALAARLFPHWPERAALRVAMRAGRSRHRAALEHVPGAFDLFWLGDDDEFALERRLDNGIAEVGSVRVPPAITTVESLGEALDDLGVPAPPAISRRLSEQVFEIDAGTGRSLLERSLALAAGYREAGHDRPVFPYLRQRV